jgi:hypothetical protein
MVERAPSRSRAFLVLQKRLCLNFPGAAWTNRTMNRSSSWSRRRFLGAVAATGLPAWSPPTLAQSRDPITRAIPSTGERLPVIGIGTWITFNVGSASAARAPLVPVMQTFFDRGGAMIDSSPMYGTSEAVIGDLLTKTSRQKGPFCATKVWTYGRSAGERQLESSLQLWRVPRFDLVHVHNMLDWETHLETLRAWKAAGRRALHRHYDFARKAARRDGKGIDQSPVRFRPVYVQLA